MNSRILTDNACRNQIARNRHVNEDSLATSMLDGMSRNTPEMR